MNGLGEAATGVGVEAADRLSGIHAASFDRPWSAGELAGLLVAPGALALMAEDEGFILVRSVLDEAEVLTLAVRPSARRRGVARALLEAAAARLANAGVRRLHLEVAEDNVGALALYAAAGFAPQGRRRGYYPRPCGPPADALLLGRPLNRPGE